MSTFPSLLFPSTLGTSTKVADGGRSDDGVAGYVKDRRGALTYEPCLEESDAKAAVLGHVDRKIDQGYVAETHHLQHI